MLLYEWFLYSMLCLGVLMVMMGSSTLAPVPGHSLKTSAMRVAISGIILAAGAVLAWTAFAQIIN